MSSGNDADDQGAPPVRIGWTLALGVCCTLGVFFVHKTKKTKSDAAKLLEDLWGFEFQPLSIFKRAVILTLGIFGLVALSVHAAVSLGAFAFTLVVGLVLVVLRNAGIAELVWRSVADALTQRRRNPLRQRDGYSGLEDPPLPVWVLTGFLGSGKTTLVNRLVRANNWRLLVVTNEAGETALDAELIMQHTKNPESVLLINNGCACCKVRGDLCDLLRDEILGGPGGVRGGAEGVVIECSGLADPRAVAQTFLLDTDLKHRLELREVVAVVDAAHVGFHLFSPNEGKGRRPPLSRLVEEQIAFASLVLLNKADCTDGGGLVKVTQAIGRINETVEVVPCTYCNVNITRILGTSIESTPMLSKTRRNPVGAWSPDRALVEIQNVKIAVGCPGDVNAGGTAATGSSESDLADSEGAVRCISVRVEGELDLDVFNRWVLRTLKDFTVLRAKGVLAAFGYDQKLAFQAVHAAFHGTPSLSSRWKPGELRFSQIVIMGIDVQPGLIELGLKRCLFSKDKQHSE